MGMRVGEAMREGIRELRWTIDLMLEVSLRFVHSY